MGIDRAELLERGGSSRSSGLSGTLFSGQAAFSAVVRGLPDLRGALSGVAPKLRRRVLRNALAAGARVVRDAARRSAPVLQGILRYRKRGTLRNAISVRTSRRERLAGNVGVFVNVRPAKKGMRGAKVPTDPFYWRWMNFGARHITPRRFLEAGAAKLQQALDVFTKAIGPQIDTLTGGMVVQVCGLSWTLWSRSMRDRSSSRSSATASR